MMKVNGRGVILLVLATSIAVLPCAGCAYVSPNMDEYPADLFNSPVEGPHWVTIPT